MEINLFIYIIVFGLLAISVITDLKTSKIRNKYIIFFILVGIILNSFFYGLKGLDVSIRGIFMPVLLLGIFFYARLIGAGDIKLFSATGALLGWKYGIYIMAYSFIFAGVLSIAGLIGKGTLKSTSLEFFREIKICIYAKSFMFSENSGKKHIVKLSPAIALGVCFQLIVNL